MAMQKMTPAESPDAYVVALDGWRRELVETLRSAVRGATALDERIKWGHLVYFSNGPVLLIRAEEARVLFGFWRGQRLREIEPKLRPGGKYEMASWELHEGETVDAMVAKRLTLAAVELNLRIGDPTAIAAPRPSAKKGTKKPAPAKTAVKKTIAAKPAKNAATRKAAAGKPSLSPSSSARKNPR